MGVDYRAKLIYGLPSEEVPELLDDSEGDYAYYDKGLDRVSPYYDSDSEGLYTNGFEPRRTPYKT